MLMMTISAAQPSRPVSMQATQATTISSRALLVPLATRSKHWPVRMWTSKVHLVTGRYD